MTVAGSEACVELPTLVERFEQVAAQSPAAPAVVSAGYPTFSYDELRAASNAVAAELLARTTDRESVVVLGHKSPLMAASFLGCLKSGHAFVPVDVEMPASRLVDIMDQLGSPLLVQTEELPDALSSQVDPARVVDVRGLLAMGERGGATTGGDDGTEARGWEALDAGLPAREEVPAPDPSLWVRGAQTQYIIFTSGSTGRPKGIEVSAANVAHIMDWLRTVPEMAVGGQVFLDQPPYSFDLSEYELVGALATGGCLHAVGREAIADMRAMFDDWRGAGLQVWVSTPSFADLCLVDESFSSELLPDVRLFLFCGEVLHHNTAAELRRRFPRARILNTYGPTEATVAITWCEVTDEMLADPVPLPVGVPRPGVTVLVRDQEGTLPRPRGEVGEIIIAGPSVAKDYYHNAQKTSAAFFELPAEEAVAGVTGPSEHVVPGSLAAGGSALPAYRTGDLGFLDEEGVLHCAGRMDSLIKLNGFRIELGDVEENIASLPEVDQAAVVPVMRDGRVNHLRAYVVLHQATDDAFAAARAVKEHLAGRVPPYMVPRKVSIVDALPMTPNGKVDRKLLAAQSAHHAAHADGPDAGGAR